MIHAYQKHQFTQADVEVLRNVVRTMPGEFSCMDAINAVCKARGAADSSKVLNSLDHLVMSSELVELTAGTECFGQDRKYRRAVGSSL